MSHPVIGHDSENEYPEDEDEECEWCGGTGFTQVDEYSKEGQLIGVGTISKKCICQYDTDDFSGATNEDR